MALERLAGKMAYILEHVLRLHDPKVFEDAMFELQSISFHRDVVEAYDLFKRISNAALDFPELKTKE